jgi:polyhydroxyalkanoate synthesis regulator phasin
MRRERIIEQIDKMVASGRITEDEAARLRATEGAAEFDAVVGAIRSRHAGVHMESAIAGGEMSQEEADRYLASLRKGEHPKVLRTRLSQHRPSRHSAAPKGDDKLGAESHPEPTNRGMVVVP